MLPFVLWFGVGGGGAFGDAEHCPATCCHMSGGPGVSRMRREIVAAQAPLPDSPPAPLPDSPPPTPSA